MARRGAGGPRSPRSRAGNSAQPPVENAQTLRKGSSAFCSMLGDHQFDAVADDSRQGIDSSSRGSGTASGPTAFRRADEWVASLKKNPTPVTFREPITNVAVDDRRDRLAHVRADFKVMRDGAAQSSGVDQFTLVREPSGWKMAVVAYTSLPLG